MAMGGVDPSVLCGLIAEYGNPEKIINRVKYYAKVVNSGIQTPVEVSARLEVGGNLTAGFKGPPELALLAVSALAQRIGAQFQEAHPDAPADQLECYTKILAYMGFALSKGKEYPIPARAEVVVAESGNTDNLSQLLRMLADQMDKKGD